MTRKKKAPLPVFDWDPAWNVRQCLLHILETEDAGAKRGFKTTEFEEMIGCSYVRTLEVLKDLKKKGKVRVRLIGDAYWWKI